jgi:hypothetical protein
MYSFIYPVPIEKPSLAPVLGGKTPDGEFLATNRKLYALSPGHLMDSVSVGRVRNVLMEVAGHFFGHKPAHIGIPYGEPMDCVHIQMVVVNI